MFHSIARAPRYIVEEKGVVAWFVFWKLAEDPHLFTHQPVNHFGELVDIPLRSVGMNDQTKRGRPAVTIRHRKTAREEIGQLDRAVHKVLQSRRGKCVCIAGREKLS